MPAADPITAPRYTRSEVAAWLGVSRSTVRRRAGPIAGALTFADVVRVGLALDRVRVITAHRVLLTRFPLPVHLDPRYCWGQPFVFGDDLVPVPSVVERVLAGEDPTVVAPDYGVSIEVVEALVAAMRAPARLRGEPRRTRVRPDPTPVATQ